LAWERAAIDLGMGGSEYDASIHWTPSVIRSARTAEFPATVGQAIESNTVGNSFVDVLLGLKLRLTETSVVAAGVSIPVVNPDFQPDVLATIALERSF
jgi:hypothetical protein